MNLDLFFLGGGGETKGSAIRNLRKRIQWRGKWFFGREGFKAKLYNLRLDWNFPILCVCTIRKKKNSSMEKRPYALLVIERQWGSGTWSQQRQGGGRGRAPCARRFL